MKKFTLKTKHLKLNHIINLGLMRHWVDFLLHFYRLNICLRVNLPSLSQTRSYLGLLITIGGHWTERYSEETRPLGNRFHSWKLILNKTKTPQMKLQEKVPMTQQPGCFKKLALTLLLWAKWPSTFWRDTRYQWMTDLLEAQNTLSLKDRKSYVLLFSHYRHLNVDQKNKEMNILSSLCYSEDRQLWL